MANIQGYIHSEMDDQQAWECKALPVARCAEVHGTCCLHDLNCLSKQALTVLRLRVAAAAAGDELCCLPSK
jgi:hypothetical protein